MGMTRGGVVSWGSLFATHMSDVIEEVVAEWNDDCM